MKLQVTFLGQAHPLKKWKLFSIFPCTSVKITVIKPITTTLLPGTAKPARFCVPVIITYQARYQGQ